MERDEKPLRTSAALAATGAAQSFSDTIIDRFIGTIAVAAGASVAEAGLINGSRQLSLNLPQIVFGRVADSLGKRRVIAAGRLLNAAALAALVLVDAPSWLLPLVVAVSLFTSMATPAWGSLLGDYAGGARRGAIIGWINSVVQVGGFAATVTALLLTLSQGGPMSKASFSALLALASAASLLSALLVAFTEEKPSSGSRGKLELGLILEDRRLRRFILLSFVFGVGSATAMPFSSFITVGKLGMTVWQVALAAVANLACNALSQRAIGRLMDRVGRRPVIVFSRAALASSCLVYAFASDWTQIVAVEAFIGVALAAWFSGQSTYVIDLAPPRLRATYLAASMTAVGVSTFIGSSVTGAIAQPYIAAAGYAGISAGLLVAGALRFTLGLLFLTAHESRPETTQQP
jgi:MFS family permease